MASLIDYRWAPLGWIGSVIWWFGLRLSRRNGPTDNSGTRVPSPVIYAHVSKVSKVDGIQQFALHPHRYGNSHATWDDHTMLCATRQS